MGKAWDTKRRILELITDKKMTPSEISEALDIAPSTVSYHLEELERMNAITKINNPYVSKWKYYKANPEFDINKVMSGDRMGDRTKSTTKMAFGVAAALIIAVVAVALSGVLVSGKSGNVSIQLTDPPIVPSGTSSLVAGYSSVAVHEENGAQSGWISATGSGSVDLMSLLNVSQIIGSASLSANSTIDMIRFNITSAHITINGTTYNVTVPSEQLTAHLAESKVVGLNGTSVLLDLSPTIASIFTDNSTIFVMVPSLKAVALGSAKATQIGTRADLNETEKVFAGINANVSMSSATLSEIGNTTVLSVTVVNNGNSNVTLMHVSVLGNESVSLFPNLTIIGRGNGDINVTPETSMDVGGYMATDVGNMTSIYAGGYSTSGEDGGMMNVSTTAASNGYVVVKGEGEGGIKIVSLPVNANATANSVISVSVGSDVKGVPCQVEVADNGLKVSRCVVPPPCEDNSMPCRMFYVNAGANGSVSGNFSVRNISVPTLVHVGVVARDVGAMDFLVEANGTLVPFNYWPSSPMMGIGQSSDNSTSTSIAEPFGKGYTLAPHSSVTLDFNGTVVQGDGHMVLGITSGQTYKIAVIGSDFVQASTSVTAG